MFLKQALSTTPAAGPGRAGLEWTGFRKCRAARATAEAISPILEANHPSHSEAGHSEVQSAQDSNGRIPEANVPSLFGLVVVVIFALYIVNSIKILSEYERGVIFRLGRVLDKPKGPGIILVFVPIDRMVRVDLRQIAFDVPPQDIITRDNVTLKVNAVIFLRVVDPRRAVLEVLNYQYQTSQFAQTTLRSVLGEVELDELLAHRDKINLRLQSILDQHTDPWGVKVVNVEVKQVDLPEGMMRAMAKQAEAEREKRSKIIHAEGEFAAAQRLADAAHLLATEPSAIQLRYLQTLTEIGVEKNTTIIFPVPVDLLAGLQKLVTERKQTEEKAGS
jgi:regulator of protease activity HflC (stomatin/prohibitin superfamily)